MHSLARVMSLGYACGRLALLRGTIDSTCASGGNEERKSTPYLVLGNDVNGGAEYVCLLTYHYSMPISHSL